MNSKTANKIVLLIGLIVLLTTSAACIFLGSLIVHISGNVKDLYHSTHVLIPTIVILSVGVSLAILGLLGFFGCILEKKILLFIFLSVLSMIFVVEITAVVLGLVLRIQIKETVESKLKSYLLNYNKEVSLKNEIDYVQSSMKCCGVNNYTDWLNIKFDIPNSCCGNGICNNATIANSLLPLITNVYYLGCADKVENFIREKFAFIILFVAIIIFIQIVSLVASCGIICGKKHGEYQQFNSGLQV